MTTLKKLLTFGLLMVSTITANANDYALLKNYPLLNDMKMVKKEQLLLDNMKSLISDRQNNNKSKLAQQKELFSKIIRGLIKGDRSLNLHGTELLFLKNKINTIELLWSQEKSILDSALNHKMYTNDAYATIEKISKHLTELNTLYAQSYARYKQNSVMRSLVNSYMQKATHQEALYAMNMLK